jgi:hypothetical protein
MCVHIYLGDARVVAVCKCVCIYTSVTRESLRCCRASGDIITAERERERERESERERERERERARERARTSTHTRARIYTFENICMPGYGSVSKGEG